MKFVVTSLLLMVIPLLAVAAPDGAGIGAVDLVAGRFSVAIGCHVKVVEDHAFGIGLRSNMAVMHADRAWSIDWNEVTRVSSLPDHGVEVLIDHASGFPKFVTPSALDPFSYKCLSPIVAAMARWLLIHRTEIKERTP